MSTYHQRKSAGKEPRMLTPINMIMIRYRNGLDFYSGLNLSFWPWFLSKKIYIWPASGVRKIFWSTFYPLKKKFPIKFSCINPMGKKIIWPTKRVKKNFWPGWKSQHLPAENQMVNAWVWSQLPKYFQRRYFLWPSHFRRRIFYISQSETRIAQGGHVRSPIRTKWEKFVKDLP